MRCRAEAIVLRLIEESLHDLRIVGAHLHPLDPILGGPPDPLPALLGAIEWSLVPCSSRPLIIYDPRRNDLIPITPRLLLEYPLMTTELDPPNRRHPMGEPELVGILGRVLRAPTSVGMEIDESMHQIHPMPIEPVLCVLVSPFLTRLQ